MTSSNTVLLLTIVIAISVSMLTWFIIDIGTDSLARYRAGFTERTKFQVQEFFLFIDARKLFVANLSVMLLGAIVIWFVTGSFLIAIPVFFALGMMPRVLYSLMRKRRLRNFEEQLPDALMMLSGGLRAGAGMSMALAQMTAEAPVPLKQEFTLLLREQRLGVPLNQSLQNLVRRVPTQTTELVVSAMQIAAETGGGLAETLERTAQTVRSRIQMEGKIAALTAQGKLQAWVVGLLPVLLMLVLNKMEPEAMGMLWHTRVGWATLAVLAILEFLGVHVIRKIVAIDV